MQTDAVADSRTVASAASDRQSDENILGLRVLREWLEGYSRSFSRVVFVDRGAPLDVAAMLTADDALVVEEGRSVRTGGAHVVRYSGDMSDVGDELFVGERGIELQDYVAAGFVQIVGPTALCFFDDSSAQAFLDDADLARCTGVFPTALIDPRVLLANRAAVESPDRLARPTALRVHGDGTVSVGVRGRVLGRAGEIGALQTVRLPRVVALGDTAPVVSASGTADREGIRRYLAATDLMKMLRLVNGAARIEGFGWAAIDDGGADAEPSASDPFLLKTASRFELADTTTLRRQILSPATAAVVAALQTSSAVDVAADRVGRRLGIPRSAATALCLEAVSALGVHVGRPAGHRARAAGLDG